MEYVVEQFRVDYGVGSIGWERKQDRPHKKAEVWMNARAAEGYRLTQFLVHGPTNVYVIMERNSRRESRATPPDGL